jgi:hypothetical protein
MSNLAPFKSNQPAGLPMPPRGDTIAQFATYLEAQRAVDYLSDQHFPVQAVTIVGVNLQMVERVTGRLTYARVALAGMLSGAWFGLFVGLLISLFGSAEGFSVVAAVIIGAAFGLLFGLISYSFTGGRRDFTSTSQIVAGEYRVLCLTEQAAKAQQLLNQLAREGGPGGFGSGGPSAPATAPVTPAPGQMQQVPVGTPAGPDGEVADQAAPVTGPTYSEMIDRKKAEDREKAEAERAEAERAEAERTRAIEHPTAEHPTPEHPAPERGAPEQSA